MRIGFAIPPPKELFKAVCDVPIAKRGQSWSESCLGLHVKEQGVYIIHHGDTIVYVGKTDGEKMTFGVRLRREFQESASGGRHIFPKLAALKTPPGIRVCLIPAVEIRKMASVEGMEVSDLALVPIFESVLIAAYRPAFQSGVVNITRD